MTWSSSAYGGGVGRSVGPVYPGGSAWRQDDPYIILLDPHDPHIRLLASHLMSLGLEVRFGPDLRLKDAPVTLMLRADARNCPTMKQRLANCRASCRISRVLYLVGTTIPAAPGATTDAGIEDISAIMSQIGLGYIERCAA